MVVVVFLVILSSLKFTFSFLLLFLSLLLFSPTLSLQPNMALQSSISPVIAHLSAATKPSSVLSSNKNLLFVDFVGLYCKSKRIRRRIGASCNQTVFSRFVNKKTLSSVKAVLDLERTTSAPQSDSEPKVCVKAQFGSSRSYCVVFIILLSFGLYDYFTMMRFHFVLYMKLFLPT